MVNGQGCSRFGGFLHLGGLGDNDKVLGFPRLRGFLCKGFPGLGLMEFTGAPGDACDQAAGSGPPLAEHVQLGSLTPSFVSNYPSQLHQPLKGATQVEAVPHAAVADPPQCLG